jgi:predicted ester cyclase
MASHAETTRQLLEAFNANRPDDAADLITDDFRDHHVPADIPRGLEGLRIWWAILHSAFDGRIDFDDVIEGDDRVASRWRFAGTHVGEFNGIPATNAKFSAEFMSIDRFEGDRIAERWEVGDLLGGSSSKLALFPADHRVDRCRSSPGNDRRPPREPRVRLDVHSDAVIDGSLAPAAIARLKCCLVTVSLLP